MLLKNERTKPIESAPLLPLSAGKSVALIGPLADSADDMLGEWAPDEAQRRKILADNPQRLYGFE